MILKLFFIILISIYNYHMYESMSYIIPISFYYKIIQTYSTEWSSISGCTITSVTTYSIDTSCSILTIVFNITFLYI